MPEDYGPWTGVGVGLQNIGQALSQRFDRQYAERERQADKYEAQARDIALNLAERGGPQVPENKQLVQQLYQTVQYHNALYKSHETPDLMQRIGRFTQTLAGRKPGPFVPTIEAGGTMTPESVMAGARLPQAAQKNDLQAQYGQVFQMLQKAYPDKAATPEGLKELQQQAVESILGSKTGAQPKWTPLGEPRQNPETKQWFQTFYNPTTLEQQTMELDPRTFQPKGTQKELEGKRTDAELDSLAQMAQTIGINAIPPKERSNVLIRMNQMGLKPHEPLPTGQLGQLARSYIAQGNDQETSLRMASEIVTQDAEAKRDLATKTHLTYDKAVAIARMVIANPGMRAPLPYSRNSPDWQLYERAYADVVSGADLGSLLGARTDQKALAAAQQRIQTQSASTDANAKNAEKNFEDLRRLAARMDENSWQTAIPALNEWIRGREVAITGNKSVNEFNSAFKEAMMEYARVISGQTDSGQLTNGAREAARDLLSRGLTSDMLNSWIDNVGLKFMRNRQNAQHEAIGAIQNQIQDLGGTIIGARQTGPSGSEGAAPTYQPPAQQPPVQRPAPSGPTPDRAAAGGVQPGGTTGTTTGPAPVTGAAAAPVPYKTIVNGKLYAPVLGANGKPLWSNGAASDPRNWVATKDIK